MMKSDKKLRKLSKKKAYMRTYCHKGVNYKILFTRVKVSIVSQGVKIIEDLIVKRGNVIKLV